MKYLFTVILFCSIFKSGLIAQNVGIGTTTPQDRLDINGQVRSTGVRIVGQNILELGVGLTKQADNGKIGLNVFGETNTLSIVGGGVNAGGLDRRIKLWADGGTFFTGGANFQNTVSIGSTMVSSSAALQLNSTNQGLLINRLTTAQRTSIANPATGLMVYDTDDGLLYIFGGSEWKPLLPGEKALSPPFEEISGTSSDIALTWGSTLAISNNYAAVGVRTADNNLGNYITRVSLYTKENGNWKFLQTITPPLTTNLSISLTDRYLLIASFTTFQNRIHVYVRNNTTGLFSFQTQYDIPRSIFDDAIVGSLDHWDTIRVINVNGLTIQDTLLRIVAGLARNQFDNGGAHIVERTNQNFSRFDIPPVVHPVGAPNFPKQFGRSVSIWYNHVVIGSPSYSLSATQIRAGKVFYYKRSTQLGSTNSWTLVDGYLSSPNSPLLAASGDSAGMKVDIGPNYIVYGAPGVNNKAGLIARITRNAATDFFASSGTFFLPPASTTPNQFFGNILSLDADNNVFAGLPGQQQPNPYIPGAFLEGAGMVLHYKIAGTIVLLGKFENSPPATNERYGAALAAEKGSLLLSIPGQNATTNEKIKFYKY